MALRETIRRLWNIFNNRDPTGTEVRIDSYGSSYGRRPDRPMFTGGNRRSLVTSVYNRIAMDAAQVNICHVKNDEDGRFLEEVDSGLNYCLQTEANLDQAARAFRQDIFMSILDEGCVALVPVDVTYNKGDPIEPKRIETMRTGKILEWYPSHIKVEVYNERTGKREDVTVAKKDAAIIENPLYAVINEPSSTMHRLARKLALLDAVDEQNSSGKLDLIIQLPYVIKTEARKKQADLRRQDIERQLSEGKYGIAYTDGTERITQLNRPLENNLLTQIEYLTQELYTQLGLTPEILNGSANEQVMLNYYSRTIEPLLTAVTEEMTRKFLSKNERAMNESVRFFRDPFKLVPVNDIAEIADKMTRNEIMTSNEIRQVIGMKPAKDPNADTLRNKNLSEPTGTAPVPQTETGEESAPAAEDTSQQEEGQNDQ